MEAFETVDVDKGNFFALMFFVIALANLVLYAFAGWYANVIGQVSLNDAENLSAWYQRLTGLSM